MEKVLTIKDGENIILRLDGVKGGPVISGKNEHEVKVKFINAYCLSLTNKAANEFIAVQEKIELMTSRMNEFRNKIDQAADLVIC